MADYIQKIRSYLDDYQAEDPWAAESFDREAAVLIAITDTSKPEIVLTKRAETLSMHRGEVALPGGKVDDTDVDVIHTALRESHEEVNLQPEQVEVLGQLDTMVTRFGMKVSPVVGLISPEVELEPNPVELDAVFTVPLEFFFRDERIRTDIGTVGDYKVMVPAWEYQGFEIWGVTAVILTQMLNKVYGMDIETGMDRIRGDFKPQDWRSVKGRKGITE